MKKLAAGLTLAGISATTVGVALIYVPAALIVGGCALAALGLFGVGVDKPKGGKR